METFWQDVRYGLRVLWKSPGFTTIAVLTLALGIGVNTSLFSVVNGVLLNPLPYPEPDRLTMLYSRTADFQESSVSYLNFLDWQKDNRSFAEMAAFRNEQFNLTGQGEAEHLRGHAVSAGYFSILGAKPVLGRVFTADEDRVGAAPVALISAGLWKRKFGSAPDILSKTMTLNGTDYSIIGILPVDFHLYSSRDVYIPMGQWNDPTFRDRAVSFGTRVIGRLKPGVSPQQAQSDMDVVAKNLGTAYPEADKGAGIKLVALQKDMVSDTVPILLVLLGAVAFVLLIACANVANLLLARATRRSREFAIRTALGASRTRVVRQLLTESVLLSFAGGALGLLLAWQGTSVVLRKLPQALPRSAEIGLDSRVLFFTLVISLLSGIIFGLAPAFKLWRTDVQRSLKEGGRGTSEARQRAQNIFVMLEMALALVLLVGAGLMVRSLARLWSVDPGFNTHNVLTFNVAFPSSMGTDPTAIRRTLRELSDQLRALPGVQAVSLNGGSLPISGDDSELPFWLEGQPKPSSNNEMNSALFYLSEPGYMKAMGLPLRRGRFMNEQDTESTPGVVVIDEALARKFFPNQDPIGKRLNLGIVGGLWEIVGVTGHVKHWGLDSEGHETIASQLYFPLRQLPDKFMPLVTRGIGVVMRTQNEPMGMTALIRRTTTQLNSQYVTYDLESMDQIVSDSLAARRFSMILLGLFAAVALVLSSIGIYGVISYLVGQRIQEIGIRMALGAQRADVLRLVVGHGVRMALIGVGVGIVAALGLTRLMSKMLFGVSSYDPLTFVGVAVLLVIVAVLACYIPAVRAMRVDPVVALRYE